MNEMTKKTNDVALVNAVETAEPQVQMPSRRRLVQAGLAAAPVVLAFSGRSAMAGNGGGTSTPACLSAISWASANPKTGKASASRSPRASGAPGLSPTKWKPVQTSTTFPIAKWPTGYKPFGTIKNSKNTPVTWNPTYCNQYSGLLYKNTVGSTKVDPGWSSGTALSWLDSRSISNVLIDEADAGSLKAHVCAAYLNALIAENNNAKFLIS
ncbi:MAG: hypothetical protein JWP29_4910, partial [Rhodoferax sp.]|nr:hypothetical protein [Rhodoferax sp.]